MAVDEETRGRLFNMMMANDSIDVTLPGARGI